MCSFEEEKWSKSRVLVKAQITLACALVITLIKKITWMLVRNLFETIMSMEPSLSKMNEWIIYSTNYTILSYTLASPFIDAFQVSFVLNVDKKINIIIGFTSSSWPSREWAKFDSSLCVGIKEPTNQRHQCVWEVLQRTNSSKKSLVNKMNIHVNLADTMYVYFHAPQAIQLLKKVPFLITQTWMVLFSDQKIDLISRSPRSSRKPRVHTQLEPRGRRLCLCPALRRAFFLHPPDISRNQLSSGCLIVFNFIHSCLAPSILPSQESHNPIDLTIFCKCRIKQANLFGQHHFFLLLLLLLSLLNSFI